MGKLVALLILSLLSFLSRERQAKSHCTFLLEVGRILWAVPHRLTLTTSLRGFRSRGLYGPDAFPVNNQQQKRAEEKMHIC